MHLIYKWAPAEIFKVFCNTGGGPIVTSGQPSCTSLNKFNFVNVLIGVRRPDRGGVFKLWSHECFICSEF